MRTALQRFMRFGVVIVLSIMVSTTAAQVPFEHVILDPAGLAPAKPYGKAIGDLSGDGRADAFASSAEDGGMHWYEFPAWAKRTIRARGTWSEDVQLTDIDADGDLDVVAGNKAGVHYYKNPLPAGDPRTDKWQAVKVGSDGTNVHDLEVGDLNGDDKVDVARRNDVCLLSGERGDLEFCHGCQNGSKRNCSPDVCLLSGERGDLEFCHGCQNGSRRNCSP